MKKKILFIILTALFSLILAADVAVAIFVPSQKLSFEGMPGGFGGQMPEGFDGEMPEGFDGEMPEGFSGGRPNFDGEMPEGFDGEMPEGFDGEMPEGFDGEMPEGFDGEMPEGFSGGMPNFGGEMPEDFDGEIPEGFGGGRGGKSAPTGGFLQTIKANWLVIFLVFAVLDGASIFMLIWTSKNEKKNNIIPAQLPDNEEALEETPEVTADGEVHLKKPEQKKKHSHYLWMIVLGGMLVLAIVVSVLTSQTSAVASQTEASVYTEVAETGNISSVLPGTGTLTDDEAVALDLPTEVQVTEWYVSNGDTVSAGDKLAQVDKVSVMSSIVAVQEKLGELDEALKAHEDDEISDTITANTNGRVKKIYATKGEGVLETMYDSGALMLISLDGMMAVSIKSEVKLAAGDIVTVTLSDGKTESGKVQSVTNGTVVVTVSDAVADYGETVSVAKEDGTKIGSGDLYIHSELKVTGFSGTVSAVKVSENEKVSNGKTLLVLTDTDYEGEYELLLAQRNKLEEQIQKLFQLYQEQYIYAGCAGVITGLDEDGAQSDVVGTSYQTAQQSGTLRFLTDGENTEEKEPTKTYENYVGMVTSITDEVAVINILSVSVEGNQTQEYSLSLSNPTFYVYNYKDGTYTVGTVADIQKNDVLMLVVETGKDVPALCIRITETGNQQTDTPNVTPEGTQKPEGDGQESIDKEQVKQPEKQPAMQEVTPQIPTNVPNNTQDEEEMEEEIETNFSVDTTTWLSIIPQDNMRVTITVDELDILSLQEGQTALVTLDAFPGQSFEGTVSAIHLSGTNSGGSSKYTAVISLKREQDMLAGMNASVVITLSTKENVLMIPEVALIEEESGVYVYTTYDESSKTFGGLTEVTTGVSDGENVEILSGLSEGSVYCYSCLDVVNYSTFTFSGGGGLGMGSMFGGGNRMGR